MKKPTNPVILWSHIRPLLNKPTGPCSLALKEGLDKRSEHPLPSGVYKLREAHSDLWQCLDEFHLLAELLRANQPLRGSCTWGDQATWIKQMPLVIAFEFGWKVLPGIQALVGDGVNVIEVAKELPGFFKRIAILINRCDEVLPSIKGPIKYEYERWLDYDSIITPLLETGLYVIESALRVANEEAFA